MKKKKSDVRNSKKKHVKGADKTKTGKKKHGRVYLNGGCGSWSWMTADLAAVLTGSLFVVELQLFRRPAVVVPYRLRLLSRGLT